MKRINIISEAIYKGQHKLVNQGAFVNMSDLMGDIFSCFGITCCNGLLASKSDYFIRRAYLIQSRKKPGANWQSLNKMVLDVYNCFFGTTLCPGRLSEQWWITTDVIRPAKTVETINFTPIIEKVLACCGIANTCIPINFRAYQEDWITAGISSKADLLALLVAMGNSSPVVSNFSLSSSIPSAVTLNNFIAASISGAEILDFTFLTPSSELNLITTLPIETSYIDVSGQAFNTNSLDILGGLFLQGTLPKSYWDSSSQLSSDQPSAGVQADLTADVNTVTF
jgi:hypothetical protein